MNISGKSIQKLGMCVAILIMLVGCTSGNTSAQPDESSTSPSPLAALPPAEPASVNPPASTTRDTNGDLVCAKGPFVLIEGLDQSPERDVQLRNGKKIHIAVTKEGLEITGEVDGLNGTIVSVIINKSVGTNIQFMAGGEKVFSDSILLRRDTYGEARTFALCERHPVEP
jgi:hypothetical protein